MLHRIIFFFFILSFCGLTAFAEVFIVTSNADSGPGTLREALTKAAANGSGEKDEIRFNLPDVSEAGRTIFLLRQLPDVSSNLIIDGTTQPGAKLGLSDAKVILTLKGYTFEMAEYKGAYPTSGALILNQTTDVEIYGLCFNAISDIRYGGNKFFSAISTAIFLISTNKTTIGSPGKGNIFFNNDYSIFGVSVPGEANLNNELVIRSNMFDLEYNGLYTLGYGKAIGKHIGVSVGGSKIIIGGDNDSQRNHFGASSSSIELGGSDNEISNNTLALDLFNKPIPNPDATSDILQTTISCSGDKLIVRNNLSATLLLELSYLKNFSVYANTNIATTFTGSRISMYYCNNGVIGSDDIKKINTILCSDFGGAISNYASKNISILKNSIHCSVFPYSIIEENIPDIKVLVSNDTEYSGTAAPNSTVYVYEDNTDCSVCNPVIFKTTIPVDVSGKWKLIGDFKGKKIISNTTLNQTSSEFTQPRFNYTYGYRSFTQQPSCGQKNGSIGMLAPQHVLKIVWYDQNDKVIGEGEKVDSLGPGIYYAKGYNGNCYVKSDNFFLYDAEVIYFDDNLTVHNPSCGKNNGSITGLNVNPGTGGSTATYIWKNQKNEVVGNDLYIENLPAGAYTLTTINNDNKCSGSYGPIVLNNTFGPNINPSKQQITPTTCNQSTGSITGITATGSGTLKYSWKNAQNQEVSTEPNLTKQPAGKYTLQVTDESSCGPVYSSEIEITELNGILLDESKIQKGQALCSASNGSIKGITATGATTYQWYNATTQKVVGNQRDLINVPAGRYYLVAANASCSKQSTIYQVEERPATQFPVYAFGTSAACYHGSNGMVGVNVTGNAPKAYRWVNNAAQNVGSQAILNNVAAGTYQLYLTDDNGCESYYNTYTVQELPELKVVSQGKITADQCGLKQGSISAANITGGLPPYTYAWYNANGQIMGSQPQINNLITGSYTLKVADARCGEVNIPYQVTETALTVAAPSLTDVQLCSSGVALLTVNNASATAIYRIYENPNSRQPVDEQTGGRFRVNIAANRSYYISQLTGTCESPRAELKVTLGLSAVNIANTFSPNGDGVNDYWQLKGLDTYPAALVQIYNRYGQLVYESKGYSTPFNGTQQGRDLPTGTYYYIINLGSNCNLLSGSLTLLR